MKRINWGAGIVFVILSFIFFIIYFVFQMVQTKVDLVNENYYESGINFEERIIGSREGITFADSIMISDTSGGSLQIYLPKKLLANEDVRVHFYRPSDKNQDFYLDRINKQNIVVNFDNKPKGKWYLKVEGKCCGKKFIVVREFFKI